MTSYLSQKIRVVSFSLMILIVVLHANIFKLSEGISRFLQLFFTQEITRIAVPLFFMISGYLFFINCDGSRTFFKHKMLRRTKSLVVPYLILTILGGILWGTFKRTVIIETVVNSVLIRPILFYQLWFLHDLIIMVFLSPLLYLVLKKMPYLWIAVCYLWITGHYWEVLNYESAFFWGAGGIIALHAPAMAEYKMRSYIPLMISLFVIWIFTSIFIIYAEERPYYVHALNLLLGVFVIWGGYDILSSSIIRSLTQSKFISYSFFLYLFHEPILTGFKKGMLAMLELNQITSMVIYVVSPILTIYTVLFMGQFTKRHSPKIYDIVTGNR